jgi:hypothetical protein
VAEAAPATPAVQARRVAGSVALHWDAAAHPMVMVRDPETGEVLSFARGGQAEIATPRTELEVTQSDGVSSGKAVVVAAP